MEQKLTSEWLYVPTCAIRGYDDDDNDDDCDDDE